MSDPMSEQDFAQKVQWEGGVTEALEYGLIGPDVVPGELRDKWVELEQVWLTHAAPLIHEMQRLIDRLAEGEE